MSDEASSKVCEARQKAHNSWVALERFVACVEFHLPVLENALQGSDHPMGHSSLDAIKQQLEKLADDHG